MPMVSEYSLCVTSYWMQAGVTGHLTIVPTVEGTFENAGPQMVGNAENTKDAHGAAGTQWIHNRSELT